MDNGGYKPIKKSNIRSNNNNNSVNNNRVKTIPIGALLNAKKPTVNNNAEF